ncbi:retrovirus-related pol polyprotein from transposon TNT 1-94 [Tanacetum coccineum]
MTLHKKILVSASSLVHVSYLGSQRNNQLFQDHEELKLNISLLQSTCEITWLLSLLKDLQIPTTTPIPILCDNQYSIALAANPIQHARTKHINIDCHFAREKIKSWVILPTFTPSHTQVVDVLTKGLNKSLFHNFKAIWRKENFSCLKAKRNLVIEEMFHSSRSEDEESTPWRVLRLQDRSINLKEICLEIDLEPDEWIKDSGCSKHMTGNRKLFSTYKAYNGGNVEHVENLRFNLLSVGPICDNKCKVIFSKHDSEITKDGKVIGKTPYELLRGRKPTLDYFKVLGRKCFILNTKDYLTKFDPKSYEGVFPGYSQNSKAYIILNKHTMKIEESLNVTFDETPPPSKTSPLVDDDLDEEKAIKVAEKKNLENDIEDKTLEVGEIVNIKESKNHPLGNVIGNLNQITLRSQAQN